MLLLERTYSWLLSIDCALVFFSFLRDANIDEMHSMGVINALGWCHQLFIYSLSLSSQFQLKINQSYGIKHIPGLKFYEYLPVVWTANFNLPILAENLLYFTQYIGNSLIVDWQWIIHHSIVAAAFWGQIKFKLKNYFFRSFTWKSTFLWHSKFWENLMHHRIEIVKCNVEQMDNLTYYN